MEEEIGHFNFDLVKWLNNERSVQTICSKHVAKS